MRQIVIVNANQEDTGYLKDLLTRQEYEIRHVPTAAELFELLKKEWPNLLIIDSRLPDMTGYDLCAQLKSTKAFTLLPILITGAYNEPSEIMHGLECQCDAYLPKPFSEKKLLVTVNNLMTAHPELNHSNRQGLPVTIHGHTHFVDREHQDLLNMLLSTLVDRYDEQRAKGEDGPDLDKALEQLRLLWRRFAEVMDSHQEGILIVNRHEVVRRANRVAASLLGTVPEQLSGKELELDLANGKVREISVAGDDGKERPVLMQVEDFVWGGEPGYLIRLTPLESPAA